MHGTGAWLFSFYFGKSAHLSLGVISHEQKRRWKLRQATQGVLVFCASLLKASWSNCACKKMPERLQWHGRANLSVSSPTSAPCGVIQLSGCTSAQGRALFLVFSLLDFHHYKSGHSSPPWEFCSLVFPAAPLGVLQGCKLHSEVVPRF